jgi:hypothetical protein
MRAKFAALLLSLCTLGGVQAADTADTATSPACPVIDTAPATGDMVFRSLVKDYEQQLVDIHYSAKRNLGYFTYNEVEIMKALEHLIRLARAASGNGALNVQGREAFYLMKQPLTYISHYLPYNPLFKHVVHSWDQSLKKYQEIVSHLTGTAPAEDESDPMQFNSADMRAFQNNALALEEVAKQFNYQVKQMPMITQENNSLVAFSDRFAVLAGNIKTNSMIFVSRKYQIENNIRDSLKISRQVTAIMMSHPNPYIRNSWQIVRDKANAMRMSFEVLMQKN